MKTAPVLLYCLSLVTSMPAVGQFRAGKQFQVNQFTTGNQNRHDVALQADGSFVVVWSSEGSYGSDDSRYSVQMRRYDPAGRPLGGEFQVNVSTASIQYNASVASAPDAGFLVVWASLAPDDILARRFDSEGRPLGGEFRVNTYTPGRQYRPHVEAARDGSFVVVWSGPSPGEGRQEIWARRFRADGQAMTADVVVNSPRGAFLTWPRVAFGDDGSMMVVWFGGTANGKEPDIWGRKLASDGAPAGPDLRINAFTPGRQDYPVVEHSRAGGWVVAWGSRGSPGSDSSQESVQARFLFEDGRPANDQFQINQRIESSQGTPDLAPLPDGRFLAVWRSLEGKWSFDVKGALLGPRGVEGDEFCVNEYVQDTQQGARVSTGGGGDFVVVWRSKGSLGSDNESYSVQGRHFRSPP